MKYEDYRVEDLVFLTREEKDWTEEEKREVIATFPESCKTEEIRIELMSLKKAVEDGVVKKSGYYRINKASGKAYVKNLNYIIYGKTKSGCYYSDDKYLFIYIDGIYKTIDDEGDIERALNYLDDIDQRFTWIHYKYTESERKYKRDNETKIYVETYKDRINANRLADTYLNKFNIEIPDEINVEKYRDEVLTRYYADTKRISGWDFTHHNEYGEILWNRTPITTEDAEKIVEIMKEATRKAELIMDRVSIELRELKEKYNKATQ